MIGYRIGSSRYRANDGAGASLHGGRWNHKGTAVIYTSESVALCALEVLANSSRLPAGLMVIGIEIPEAVSIKTVQVSELPAGWDDPRPSSNLKSIGTNWVRSNATAVLSVPSSIVARERNYLLNPSHPEFGRIRFGAPEPFRFDPRLK